MEIRSLDNLINLEEPAWTEIQNNINVSSQPLLVLPTTREQGQSTLSLIQVTSRSALGALALNTSGIILDNGFLRILGAGDQELPSLATVNGYKKPGDSFNTPYLIAAYDVTGGIFAINAGGILNAGPGEICYLSQRTFEWEPLGLGHGDFVAWAIDGTNLPQFYQDLRWNGWEQETQQLPFSSIFAFFPYLSTVQGQDLNTVHRNPVPVYEILGEGFYPALRT